MEIIELTDKIYDKLHKEFLNDLDKIKMLPSVEIENKIYEILFKQEIIDMFKGRERYNDYELRALLKKENCLDYLYSQLELSNNNIKDRIENEVEISVENIIEITMMDLAVEDINKLKQEIYKNSNYELIEMINDSLNELNNYDYCTHLKRKYNIDEFSIVDVFNIFNTKNGIEDLYYNFANLIDSEHLFYLTEISLLNSDSYRNIEDKILPELKKLLNEKEKNKQNINKNKKSKGER